jgi:hypothetical protein
MSGAVRLAVALQQNMLLFHPALSVAVSDTRTVPLTNGL